MVRECEKDAKKRKGEGVTEHEEELETEGVGSCPGDRFITGLRTAGIRGGSGVGTDESPGE